MSELSDDDYTSLVLASRLNEWVKVGDSFFQNRVVNGKHKIIVIAKRKVSIHRVSEDEMRKCVPVLKGNQKE